MRGFLRRYSTPTTRGKCAGSVKKVGAPVVYVLEQPSPIVVLITSPKRVSKVVVMVSPVCQHDATHASSFLVSVL